MALRQFGSSLDYKSLVLEVLWNPEKNNRLVCELRMTLFYRAVEMSISNPACLMPFPSAFFDPETKTKRYEDLKECLGKIPPLDDILEDSKLSEEAWTLLFWIFTNPLEIEPLIENFQSTEIDAYPNIMKLRRLTGLQDIPIPDSKSTYIFNLTPSQPKQKFLEAKIQFGSFFAYHGSKLENFHSIMHRGLVCALNVHGAYGHGTYLSDFLEVSKDYGWRSKGWPNSALNSSAQFENRRLGGSVQCVAIVEVVKHPSVKNVSISHGTTYHVVDQDDLMQLSHLIIYTTL